MGKRREGRQAAVQYLYQADLAGEDPGLDRFFVLQPVQRSARSFLKELVEGVRNHSREIDQRLAGYLVNYELKRVGAVERSVLRMALYEMFYSNETPPVVVINEAIELAKRFGDNDSGRFVNGILERAKKDLTRPLREAADPVG